MIYAIVAIDDKNGLANDKGIPWDLPSDKAYFREKTTGRPILMGYQTYLEFKEPLSNRRNFVQVRPGSTLRPGFEPIEDVTPLLANYQGKTESLWVIGGAKLFTKLMPSFEKLYITRVQGDFACTKFFPEFKDKFLLDLQLPPQQENGLTFQFEVWSVKLALNS